MFLESLFLYVWLECPRSVFDAETGHIGMLERNWKTVLYLLDEAQFGNGKQPPKLDTRMEQLAKKKPDHPAVKAYQRYRSGPDDTVRSVIMTVNARMQPFDNEELLEVFSDNEIPALRQAPASDIPAVHQVPAASHFSHLDHINPHP